MKNWKEKQEELLKVLYSGEDYTLADKLLAELYEKWRPFAKDSGSPLTQKDCMLITYGDALREEGKDPLEVLDHPCDDLARYACCSFRDSACRAPDDPGRKR